VVGLAAAELRRDVGLWPKTSRPRHGSILQQERLYCLAADIGSASNTEGGGVAEQATLLRYSGLLGGSFVLTGITGQSIAVAGATDARYAMPLAVMLCSIGNHAGPGVLVDAYIVDDGVTREDRAKVESSLPVNVHLHWVAAKGGLEGLPTWGRMPLTTYRKLTVAEWTPAELNRVIWLDCDLLVLEDISALWRTPLGDRLAMAVQDPRVPLASSQFGVAA
jgi:hypothetical protein